MANVTNISPEAPRFKDIIHRSNPFATGVEYLASYGFRRFIVVGYQTETGTTQVAFKKENSRWRYVLYLIQLTVLPVLLAVIAKFFIRRYKVDLVQPIRSPDLTSAAPPSAAAIASNLTVTAASDDVHDASTLNANATVASDDASTLSFSLSNSSATNSLTLSLLSSNASASASSGIHAPSALLQDLNEFGSQSAPAVALTPSTPAVVTTPNRQPDRRTGLQPSTSGPGVKSEEEYPFLCSTDRGAPTGSPGVSSLRRKNSTAPAAPTGSPGVSSLRRKNSTTPAAPARPSLQDSVGKPR